MWRKLAVAVSGLALIMISAGGASAAPRSPAHLAPSRAAAAVPRVTLSPASGPPTTTVAVSGTGFGAYEGVDLYFGTKDMALAGTSRTGRFGPVSVTVPASAIPAQHWVSAQGRRTRLFAQTPFTVRANWSQFGFSANRQGVNPYENVLSPATVPRLDENWSFATSGPVSSPTVANGLAYVGSYDHKVYALNASTGAKRWSFTTGDVVNSPPTVASGLVYVNSWDRTMYALNAATGAKRWSFTTGAQEASSPTVVNGLVYVGSANGKVYALNASTGARRWSFTAIGPVASPAVADGLVVVGAGQPTGPVVSVHGKVYALNASSGARVWTFTTGNDVASAPVVTQGVVYITDSVGKLYALNLLQQGGLRWSFPLGGPTLISPAVAHGVVYIGSVNGNLYALNASTGAKLWSFNTGGPVYSSPVVANGVVYVGSNGARVYALNASTGAELWSFPTSGIVYNSVAVANGVVYVPGGQDLYAFGLPGAPAAPARPTPRSLHPVELS